MSSGPESFFGYEERAITAIMRAMDPDEDDLLLGNFNTMSAPLSTKKDGSPMTVHTLRYTFANRLCVSVQISSPEQDALQNSALEIWGRVLLGSVIKEKCQASCLIRLMVDEVFDDGQWRAKLDQVLANIAKASKQYFPPGSFTIFWVGFPANSQEFKTLWKDTSQWPPLFAVENATRSFARVQIQLPMAMITALCHQYRSIYEKASIKTVDEIQFPYLMVEPNFDTNLECFKPPVLLPDELLDYMDEAIDSGLVKDEQYTWHFIAVPDEFYRELQHGFDRGADFLYTCQRDGGRRKIKRLSNRVMVDFDDELQLVIPRCCIEIARARPTTRYGQRVLHKLQEGKQELHPSPTTVEALGLTTAQAMKPPKVRGSQCEHCYGPAEFRCVRCAAAFYCNPDCQEKNWPKHKSICKLIQRSSQNKPADVVVQRSEFSDKKAVKKRSNKKR